MSITIYQCRHLPEELNERIEELVKKCDILVLEEPATEYYGIAKKYFNELSKKGYSSIGGESFFKEHGDKLESFIRNSKKQIEVEKSPISLEELRIYFNLLSSCAKSCVSGELKKICDITLKERKYLSEMNKKRDNALSKQLIKLQKESRGKNILTIIGVGHSAHIELKKRGIEVKQEFPYKPYVFDIATELERRIRFDLPYTEGQVARTFPEGFISSFLRDSGLPSHQIVEKARKILERLSYEDIKDLSTYISENNSRKEMPRETTVIWLRNKGFEI